jgi:uncharacterized membrane protein YkgB
LAKEIKMLGSDQWKKSPHSGGERRPVRQGAWLAQVHAMVMGMTAALGAGVYRAMPINIVTIDRRLIAFFRRTFLPVARLALFVVFFWFGALKFFDLSPAGPLAEALTARTVGLEHFSLLYHGLSLLECLIGVLFLFPKATRVVIPLLFAHMILVSGPLVLVPELTWHGFLVPTLEGQYIIKNMAIIAVAIGIAAQTKPIAARGRYFGGPAGVAHEDDPHGVGVPHAVPQADLFSDLDGAGGARNGHQHRERLEGRRGETRPEGDQHTRERAR